MDDFRKLAPGYGGREFNKETSRARRGVLQKPERDKPLNAKKNTKRWCGGHVGRVHTPKAVYGTIYTMLQGWLLKCSRCQKHLDTWYDSKWCRREAPQWVKDAMK